MKFIFSDFHAKYFSLFLVTLRTNTRSKYLTLILYIYILTDIKIFIYEKKRLKLKNYMLSFNFKKNIKYILNFYFYKKKTHLFIKIPFFLL